MKEISYNQLIKMIENEDSVSLKNVSIVVDKLLMDSDEFIEYDYEKDSRSKMRNLAELITDERLVILSDSDDFHNLAVDYARENMFDCAIWILKRGLKQYPLSADLLADAILYGRESGQINVCEKAFASLMKLDKRSWGWRAYSFTIDYYLEIISRFPKGPERTKLKSAVNKLADEFIKLSQIDVNIADRAYFKKSEVIKQLGGTGTQEEYLLKGYNSGASAPLCALKLADISFDRGEYAKSVEFLKKCIYSVNSPQPEVNPAYVYLLSAMSKTSKIMIEAENSEYSSKTDEIQAIYKDFHTAMNSSGINQRFENAAKRTIKVLEIQTGIKDKTVDFEDEFI